MVIEEDKQFSKDYLDPEKRSIANAIQIYFKDGTHTEKVVVEYPIGHRRRRAEGIPLLYKKFENNVKVHYSPDQTKKIVALFSNKKELENMPIHAVMDLLAS